MGLLDSILGSVMGGSQNQGSGQAALINAVIQMIANRQGSGGGGGLPALVQAFTQNGMGNIASSWVGTGQNLPVSPDQIRNALGSDNGGGLLAQIAQSAGMSQGEASS